MYIWILLATIMIGLSFFNLSPRPDKENAYTEVKASTAVTRFKLENMAMTRFMQCEVLLGLHTNNWDSDKSPFQVTMDSSFQYTVNGESITVTPQDSLPIGYVAGEEIPEDKRPAEAWLLMGNILMDKEKKDEAIFMYGRAILTDPKFYKAYYNLGNVYLADDKFNMAIEQYNWLQDFLSHRQSARRSRSGRGR